EEEKSSVTNGTIEDAETKTPEKTIRETPISHPPVDAPLCSNCIKMELVFLDPNCPKCRESILMTDTTIAQLFAVMRQWTPQAQQNINLLMEEILKRGAHINDRDGLTDMSLLHFACKAGAEGIGDPDLAAGVVEKLLESGADVRQRCRWTQMTALHYAAFFGVAPVLKLLLRASKGKDINSTCPEFENGTPLHIAAANLCLEAVATLLEFNANPTLHDDLGRTPLECIPEAASFKPITDVVDVITQIQELLKHAEAGVLPKEPGLENISGRALLQSMNLKLGDRVFVCSSTNRVGTLRFCGRTEFSPGIWAGIELDTPEGKNDGSVKGVLYFKCAENYGIFAPINKIGKDGSPLLTRKASVRSMQSRVNYPKVDLSHVTSKIASGLSVSKTDSNILSVGERVFITGRGKGSIRFAGETQFANGLWYGIELDKCNGKNDGSVHDIRYFTCPMNHGIFAPQNRLSKLTTSSEEYLSDMGSSFEGTHNLSSLRSTPELPLKSSLRRNASLRSSQSAKQRNSSLKRSFRKITSTKESWLSEGMSVLVNNKIGVIRYIGPVEFADDTWIGVEFSEPIGKNDGSVKEKRYFTCKPNYGLLVRPHKVTVRGINGAKLLHLFLSAPGQSKMASGQRAFAQRLMRQQAADVRRQIANSYNRESVRGSGISTGLTIVPLCDVVDPLDYEDFSQQHQTQMSRDPMRHLLEFPEDDLEVCVEPRKCRTVESIVPEENLGELNAHVRDCVQCYTSDWIVVHRRYQHYSSSCAMHDPVAHKLTAIGSTSKQEFEIDLDDKKSPIENGVIAASPVNQQDGDSDEKESLNSLNDTPRGSWASSVFDLRNSASDPLIPSLLDRVPIEDVDNLNEKRRSEDRQESVFALYPLQDEDEIVERRLPPEMPAEQMGHRILVKCLTLKLELEIEPIFATMALYDAKEKKKISENFYFDMNPEPLKRMLTGHIPYSDISTLARSCIFDISSPTSDIFLVVKLEKVLQGDINECVEPYMKDDKNRDKIKANAVASCERLGKYRMPFAWTAIYLMNIVNGVNNQERDSGSDRDSANSNSLERKTSTGSFEAFRKKAGDTSSLSRRGSLERKNSSSEKRGSWSPEDLGSSLTCFRPVTLTVSSFFKQESERLRDEDLYKFLADLKRPSSVLKRLKCLPGILKLDISPSPDEHKYSLSPELARLIPYPDEKGRPTKEILEFPAKEIYVPHYTYRDLLFVYPKDLNFANRPGSARNITCKVQLMSNEDEDNALPVIFGESSCPEYTTYAFTSVSYHNKCPDFYNEIKIKIPATLTDQHHLLFTFYHVSCQRKETQMPVETPIGYTWHPIFRGGRLQTGDFSLPVMIEKPPMSYASINTAVQIPGIKWVDNHKGIFSITIEAVSSVHSQDKHLDRFLQTFAAVEDQNLPPRMSDLDAENDLKASVQELSETRIEQLVKFLPLILDKLIRLLVRPPSIGGQTINMGQMAFEAMALIVYNLSTNLDVFNDQHSRHNLLTTYIGYECTLPHPDNCFYGSSASTPTSYALQGRPMSTPLMKTSSASNPDLAGQYNLDDAEVSLYTRGLDRSTSLRTGAPYESNIYLIKKYSSRKIVHEELALQWVVSSGSAREHALTNAWFFFELMVKSMMEHLAGMGQLDAPRKLRFSEQFTDDITTLVTTTTSDIISRYNREVKDMKFIQTLNTSLAFFLFDLFAIMDRGYVFSLIKTYCKQISAKISSLPDAAHLIALKLEFLRIVCSHEHYIPLNLPFGAPLTPSGASSPCPSVASSTSQSSFISSSTLTERGNFAELTTDFRQQHFLVGLILSDLATVLEIHNPTVHIKAVNTVRNLLTCHDSDPRYTDAECTSRVAALYLPLVGIVMDALPQLYDWHSDHRGRPLSNFAGNSDYDHHNNFNQSVAMAIAGGTIYMKTVSHDSMDPFQQSRKSQLNAETTRHLLVCFLWVLKNVEVSLLKQWWSELPTYRLHQLLEVLFICVSCFEYKGKRCLNRSRKGLKKTRSHSTPIGDELLVVGAWKLAATRSLSNSGEPNSSQGKKNIKKYVPQNFRKSSDIKSKLEDAILGQGNARSEMIKRQKDRNPPSPSSHHADRLRWRKDQTHWKQTSEQIERPKSEIENDAHIEGNLATETAMIIVDTLEIIIQVVSQSDNLQGLLGTVLRVLLHALACNQSTAVLKNLFATQRSLVFKYPTLLFDEETEQCADLCLRLLKHCSSSISSVRAQASASLYLLMRQNFEIGNNFARVKMQVTMSLSSLVGTSQNFNEEYLRRSLKTILTYAEEDVELQETTFPEQVHDMVFNLHMILSDTVKMKEFQEDPEMLLDLMYRIAKGYQNSPDLRLTWLANMAQKHTEKSNHAEAAHCLIHSAALVAEYLHMLEDKSYLPIGAVTFEALTPDVLEESAVSDDVVSPDEEGICTGKYFTENGLIGLLEQAASSFNLAGMFEAMNVVYKILIPIAEANRDFKKLANIHSKLHEAFSKIDHMAGKRVFGTYFRVGFYGSKFGDLDGEEFIYKEPILTKLPEVSHRLQGFYAEKFGSEYLEVIKDSNTVDLSKLNPEKAYLQITYVEPYFDLYELRDRVTPFDKNYNIKRFIYSTPFTMDGRAHGELHEQYKRKTILTTTNSFPYVKTRVQVVDRKQMVLTPIEVAIEDIQKKTLELALATQQEPPDPKILQMVLQGCIGTTVNQGPMEVAIVFLSDLVDGDKQPNKYQNKLRLCFKDFSKRCSDALRRNKTLICSDQKDYQRELERNYHRFTERLLPIVTLNSGQLVARTRRRMVNGSVDANSLRF
uniref:Uncharacterized protein n=1 Tax=Strigamia maritima TaxID=126957 RepID=T1J9Y0_STRMM